jgi:hypothetical protein
MGLSSILLFSLFISLVLQSVSANECAAVSLVNVPFNKDLQQLVLIEHNGKRLVQPLILKDGQQDVEARKIYLAPGQHQFKGLAGTDAVPCGALHDKKFGLSQTGSCDKKSRGVNVLPHFNTQLEFTINVEADEIYEIVARQHYPTTLIGEQTYSAILLKQKSEPCIVTDPKKLYQSLPAEPQIIAVKALPEQLQNEFQLLMLEITEYAQQFYPPNTSIALNRTPMTDYFYGISGELQQQDQQFGLLVNNVLIQSPAEQLGVQSRDVILAINDKKLTAPGLSLMRSEITGLNIGDEYSVMVRRSGKHLTLQDSYDPMLLSGFKMSFSTPKEQQLVPEFLKASKGLRYITSASNSHNQRLLGFNSIATPFHEQVQRAIPD